MGNQGMPGKEIRGKKCGYSWRKMELAAHDG